MRRGVRGEEASALSDQGQETGGTGVSKQDAAAAGQEGPYSKLSGVGSQAPMGGRGCRS